MADVHLLVGPGTLGDPTLWGLNVRLLRFVEAAFITTYGRSCR